MTTQPALAPAWLVRAAAVGWRVLATIGMGTVLLFVASRVPVSITATLVSLVFAAALAPTALRLRARGLPRMAAAGLTFAAGAGLVILAAVVLVIVLVGDLRAVSDAVQDGVEQVRDRLTVIGSPDALTELVERITQAVQSTSTPDLAAFATIVGNVVTVVVLGTFLTFFLLADGDRGWAWFLGTLKPWQAATVEDSARRGLDQVAWYVRRTALLATLDGVVTFVVLALLGVPLAGALAAVAFLAGFVPYLGAVAGGVIVALAALALGGPIAAIAVIAALIIEWILATRLLERTSMDSSVDVHPILVLVALPAGVALFGFLGLLALLPITVFGRAVARSVVAALDVSPGTAGAGRADLLAAGAGGDGAADPADPLETAPPNREIPRWLDRLGQWSWRGLVLAALAGLVIQLVVRLPEVVVPAVIAGVGGATLAPLVDRLTARGTRRSVAAAGTTVGAVVVIVGSCLLAISLTLGQLQEVVGAAAAGAGLVDLAWLGDAIRKAGGDLQANLTTVFLDFAGLAFALLLALLMTYFFLKDGPGWWQSLITRLTPGRREPIEYAGEQAGGLLAGYMIGTAAISAFGAATTGLLMVLLGLPLAFPIMVIGFFAGFIPYIGSFVTTILATLVTVALGTTSDLVIMVVFTIVFNIVQGNFVTPLVYGKSLSLHPAIVLMAIPVGNEIAGILGMFLVVPIAAMVAATWRLVPAVIDGTGLPRVRKDRSGAPVAPVAPDLEPRTEPQT